VLCGPGENAGIIDIATGTHRLQDRIPQPPQLHRAVSKCAATGRRRHPADIFTMGARPSPSWIRCASPAHRPVDGARNARIVDGVVAGIAH
jgi:hypothetical protein